MILSNHLLGFYAMQAEILWARLFLLYLLKKYSKFVFLSRQRNRLKSGI